MMMKSNKYWKERSIALEKASHDKGAYYFAELEKQYVQACSAVQDDINKWYMRFAKNNEITLQEAKKMLGKRELEEFKWSVQEYIKKGRENGTSGQWSKQLENASARVHISRLDAIKMQMQNHVELLYGNELDDVSKLMEEIYTSGYYHTAFELQKGFNVGYSLMKLNANEIEKIISKPWASDGSNFSDRIWKQKSQLVSELHNNLTQAIIRGKSPFEVTEVISKRFNVSKNQAGRLIMTESAFFAEESSKDAYKELGVEKYQILATLDERTSDICQDLDGEVFKMSEYEVGITAPPFHCYCRSTTVPYFDDEFELGTQRASRDSEGKTDYVPADMKYKDWYKKYVVNSTESSRIKEKGAISGALNDNNDPNGVKRELHAERYYESIRNSDKDYIINSIAENTNIDVSEVEKMYQHLFINKYNLDDGKKTFDADYDIAQSIQRLREGVDIQKHDLTLVHHEALEYDIMSEKHFDYREAHDLAEKEYNYAKELVEWKLKTGG